MRALQRAPTGKGRAAAERRGAAVLAAPLLALLLCALCARGSRAQSSPQSPPPPPWLGPTCAFGESHKFSPNAAGNITSGTALSARLVVDQTDGTNAWVMTAGSGVTYDGTSLSFDGSTNAYVSFGSVTFGGSPFTISVWGKYRSFDDAYSRIVEFQPASQTQTGVMIAHWSTSSKFWIVIGGAGGIQNGMPLLELNTWFHIAVAVTLRARW
jgi:hypothetical protein